MSRYFVAFGASLSGPMSAAPSAPVERAQRAAYAGKYWFVALTIMCAWTPGCAKQKSQPPDAASQPGAAARPPQAPAGPDSPQPRECGAQPCCGVPPQPCSSWFAEQRAKAGAVVVEQVPAAECAVFIDGQEWPEGRKLRELRFVPPGMHTVECRGPAGVLFSRRLEVAIGRDTPLFWGF